MKRSALMLLVVWLLAGCGASSGGGGTVEQGMIDAIKGYTQVIYQNDQASFTKYMCQKDADTTIKQLAENNVGTDLISTGSTYDLSEIKWRIGQRSPDGSVVQLEIESGKLKVTFKDGRVSTEMPVPGSAGGVRLKNESGWKVCTSASIK